MSRKLPIILLIIYLGCMPFARNGYGYMGYHGFNHGPSFFYWGGPRVNHNRNIRSGSIGGSSTRGGGPNSGK